MGKLTRDVIRERGLICGIPNELYYVTISKSSTIYVEKIGRRGWELYVERYWKGGVSWKIIAKGELWYVLKRYEGYIDFIIKKRSE